MTESEREEVERYLARWQSLRPRRRRGAVIDMPIFAMQAAALGHEDPAVRRSCLGFLDRYAKDVSTGVFVAALRDPVAPIRETALHGLAGQEGPDLMLEVPEVMTVLAHLIRSDPSPEVRRQAIPILLRLADHDPQALKAIERAVTEDEASLLREDSAAENQAPDPVRARGELRRRAGATQAKRLRRPA